MCCGRRNTYGTRSRKFKAAQTCEAVKDPREDIVLLRRCTPWKAGSGDGMLVAVPRRLSWTGRKKKSRQGEEDGEALEWQRARVSHLGGLEGVASDGLPFASPDLLLYNGRDEGDFASVGEG